MSAGPMSSFYVRVLAVAVMLIGVYAAAEPWLTDSGRETYRITKGLLLVVLGVGMLICPSFFGRSDDDESEPDVASGREHT